MSKGKNISIPTTVEAQIRTRARSLSIDKCYINNDWEKAQMAAILISRKHSNGNITLGNFLVDLKLRGVKDCFYRFNESPLRMEEIRQRHPKLLEECDYNLVHNIIYAGLEFAEDYGFEPHKNFKTAQYILEEDSDDIPLIEIPLGDNGIPVLEIPYGENRQQEIAILNKTAGEKYRLVVFDKDGKPERFERTYMSLFNEALETNYNEFVNKYYQSDYFKEHQVIIDLTYMTKCYTDAERKQIDDVYDIIIKDPRLNMPDSQFENDHDDELDLSIKYFEEGDTDKASIEFRKVIDKYPDDPLLWNAFLYNLTVDSNLVDENAVKEAYSRFPEHPIIKAWYGEWLVQKERFDEVFTLFNHISGLDALTTEDIYFGYSALPSFCFAYALAWLDKEDVLHAEPYYQIIARAGFDYRLGAHVQEKMFNLKREKFYELHKEEMFASGDEPEE